MSFFVGQQVKRVVGLSTVYGVVEHVVSDKVFIVWQSCSFAFCYDIDDSSIFVF